MTLTKIAKLAKPGQKFECGNCPPNWFNESGDLYYSLSSKGALLASDWHFIEEKRELSREAVERALRNNLNPLEDPLSFIHIKNSILKELGFTEEGEE